MSPDQIAQLAVGMNARCELAVGRVCELVERRTGKRLDAVARAELREVMSWELSMAMAAGLSAGVTHPR